MSKKFLVFCVLVLGLATNTWAQVPAGVDVGNPALAGSFSYDPGTDSWTVIGCGADIWGGWDQFHYVFRPLAGDGSGVVRVVSMDLTHEWAKVGVMIRETLAGDSKHIMVSMTGTHGVQSVWREETGGASSEFRTDIALPIYLKVERIGNTFNTYMTFNPAFWVPQASVTIDMQPNVTIGMFVCSTDSAQLNTTVFDSLELVAPPYLTAWAISPADGILADLGGETISWMPGDTAASHNVYFGTESPPPLIGNQTETTYDTGALEGGVTYYYRIDEVEADGTTVHAGEERSMYTMRPGTGTITREVWEGIGGVEVWDLTNNANYPANPSWSDELTSFNVDDFADNFGSRIHGWLMPQTSGEYTFWIASDDSSDLWLSTSESPADAVRIAYVSGWTGNRQWDSQANQNSTNVVGGTIPLEAGQKYYISALYKEGGGGDNCSVAWEGPDNPTRGVIDGYYLMPFENLWAWSPSPADGATGVDMSPTLSWSPAVDAVSYEVYVDDVLVAETAGTSVTAGPFALSDPLYPSTHNWRVDVVTNSPARTGVTWTFTVADHRVIDDFESYDMVPELISGQFPVVPAQTIEAVAPPEQTVIGGDVTIEAVAPPEQAVIPSLWAYYPLNGDTQDASGNGRHGIARGGPAFVAGADGQAMMFDGTGAQYVDLGRANPSAGTGQLTLSLWANWTGVSGAWQGLIGKRDTWAEGEMMWQIEGTNDAGYIRVGRNAGEEIAGFQPEVGVWEHICFSFDGTTGSLYHKGALVASGPFSIGPDTGAAMVFGACEANGNNPYNGALDEVRIYSTALSEAQVGELAALGDPVVDPTSVLGPLVAHYKLDGDLTDSSGNGVDGTAMGGDPAYVAGMDGQAVALDGVDDFIDFGQPAVWPAGRSPRSVCAWAKADSVSGGWHWAVAYGNAGTGTAMFLGRNGDDLFVGGYGDDPRRHDFWVPDVWHHLCLTYDGTTARMYADGVEINSKTKNWDLIMSRAHIGRQVNDAIEFWDGPVDDVRIYNIALSEGEVRYLAGVGDTYVPPIYGPMRAHYELDGDASDSSGNGYDGVLVGDPQWVDGAVELDGDDCIDLDNPPELPEGTSAKTICGWAKTDTIAGGWAWVAAYGTGGGLAGEAVCIGRNGTTLYGGGMYDDVAVGNFWEADVWHHICLTFDGATAKVYTDGIEVASSPRNWNLQRNYAYIGRQCYHGGENWDGMIDDVRIYDYALSAGEVAYLTGGDVVVPPVYGPMRLHLEFEGDLTDSSGNGNDGTAYGAVGFESDPVMGNVLDLPGGDNQFVGVPRIGMSGNDPTTIACWAKADHTSIPNWTLIFGFTGTETGGGGTGSHFNIGSLGGPGGVGAHVWGWEETIFSDQQALEWHHYAMTYDGTTIRYYGDGKYMDTDTGKSNVMDLSIRGDRVHVGSRITQASSFPGNVDDARVYDYVLTEGQIATLAGVVPTNVISDTWSDLGLVEFMLDAGTMRVDTYGWPGLAYYVGEVSRALPFADLTEGGGRSLSTWFRGEPANTAGLIYASLADADGQSADVVYYGDLTSADWQEWNVDLAEFAGVDLTNAADITIGVAGLDGSIDGDIMNFDNLAVYSGRCMPDIKKPAADLNNDCVVDVDDLMILAGYWGATTPTCTVTGDGGDIWGSADAFHYAYKELTGDATVIARVVDNGSGSNCWAKGGVMIRQSLDAGSNHAYMPITDSCGNGASFQRRHEANGGSSNSDSPSPVAPPYWVKLERVGNDFSGFISPDGVAWTQLGGAETIVMTDPVLVGLAVTSHASGELRTFKFDNVTIDGELVTGLVGVDIGDTTPGSSECALILSPADLDQDVDVDWMDVVLMLGEWLDEELWP